MSHRNHRFNRTLALASALPLLSLIATTAWADGQNPHAANCSPDSVRSGTICVDRYEASVWRIPASSRKLIDKVREGNVSTHDLEQGGATQFGVNSPDLAPGCDVSANGCKDFYAVSVTGVYPAQYVNWFQAAATCRNAGKRLLTNAEWQVAALGTPDPGFSDDRVATCNTFTQAPSKTGARAQCKSDVGAYDMVGNQWEWTAEWTSNTQTQGCASLLGTDDFMQLCPNPVAYTRGGGTSNASGAGVFALWAGPQLTDHSGFRCGGNLR